MVAAITPSRKRILRPALLDKQGNRCCYCGDVFSDNPWSDAFATIEHIQDRAKGGGNITANLALACRGCNERAGREGWSERFKRARIRAANIIDLADLVVEHMEVPPEYLRRFNTA